MNFYIVIPAHNEQDTIGLTLESLVNQTLLPKKIVVVDDHSSDRTSEIVLEYCSKYTFVDLVNSSSTSEHLPGAKIINAFYKGYEILDDAYDVICKYDADLIFPENYLATLANHFQQDNILGMASGVCYIQKGHSWVLEDITGKDHIRGALKAYRKSCFMDIGKLKRSMGWDTVDELLAKYHDWDFLVDDSLHVKHLKPTGASYNKAAKNLQGEAMYKMRLGYPLTVITALKMGYKKKSLQYVKDFLNGYSEASKTNLEPIVSAEEGKFIRNLRWKGIWKKFT